MKIGRNAPCPCGSGKKYKHCCGSGQLKKTNAARDFDVFNLSRRLAYVGKVGKKRKEFCKSYLKTKKAQFEKVRIFQEKQVANANEAIQCYKGCVYCCAHYVGGSLQECEAIVYYLYQNEHALDIFLKQYPEWRSETRKNEALFQRISISFKQMVTLGYDDHVSELHSKYSEKYLKQNIFCPFLHSKECLVYPARPKACASLFATTTPEWCNPLNKNIPEQHAVTSNEPEPPFYYGSKSDLILSNVPLMVFEILKGGFFYLAGISSLRNIDKKVLSDPQAHTILMSFKNYQRSLAQTTLDRSMPSHNF
jgi:Fe-S-cluster containining protein